MSLADSVQTIWNTIHISTFILTSRRSIKLHVSFSCVCCSAGNADLRWRRGEPKRDAPKGCISMSWERAHSCNDKQSQSCCWAFAFILREFLLQTELVCFQKWKGHVLDVFRYWRNCFMLREWCWQIHAGIKFDCFLSRKLLIYCIFIYYYYCL